jgi:putative MATE family efflux protein
MTHDLTKGNIYKNITWFALPIILGLIIQQLYNLVDSVIVGQFFGEDGIAAIGTTASINGLIVALGTGTTGGFAIVIAQKFGAKDYIGLKKSVGNAISLAVILCAILTIAALVSTRPLLDVLNVPANIYEWSYEYITWIYIGIFTIVGYNMITAILRSVGNSVTPLIFLSIASVINVGLDLLFVGVLRLGVGSAALATVISQAISGIGCYIYAFKRYPILQITFHDLYLERKEAWRQIENGLPMGLQFSIICIGIIAVQSVINSFATPTDNSIITAFTACVRIESIVIVPFWGVGAAMAAYMGQNYGARNKESIVKGLKIANRLALLIALFCLAVLMPFGPLMINLFVRTPSANLLQYARTYFWIIPPFYASLGTILVYRNSLQGLGDAKFALFGGIIELVFRVLTAYGLAPLIGYYAVFLSNPITWTVTAVFFVLRYFFFMKKMREQFFLQPALSET